MKRQNFLRSTLCLLLGLVCHVVWAQAVIFPQAQQPGPAVVMTVDDGYTIGNNLFTAKFVKADGKLTFGGSEALGLIAGSEIFKVQLGDGTEVPASAFTLGEVVTEALVGNSEAVKAARRYNGQQIKATFTHSSGLAIEWRAVLRDGSHYLRTEMDIKNPGTEGIAMNSITPMMYTVQNVDGEKAPAVVGNTRGAVIASDKIFAGVETPTAYNMAGEATDLEAFVFKAWDGASSWAWAPEEAEIPSDIKNLSQYAKDAVNASRGYLIFRETGDYTITLDYTSGSNRLQILGVDILDVNGNVVDTDYHFGFTGGSDSNRDYTVTVSEVGAYMLRIFVTNAGSGEGYSSKGTITYSKKVTLPELVYDLASTQTPYVTPEIQEPETLLEITPEEGALTASQRKQTQWTSGLSQFSDWTKAIPEGMSTPTASAIYLDKHYTIEAGNLSVVFDYTGGSHELNMLGVQLISTDGVVSKDYHVGFTGGSDRNNTYSLVVPSTGDYIVRMFVDKKSDGVDGAGNIDFTLTAFTYDKISIEVGASDTWTSAWTDFANWTGTLPEGTTATGTAKYIDKNYLIDAGKLSVLFDYTGGNHGLYMLGVQVLDFNGKVVSEEFKNGFTGSSSTVTYTVTAPKAGLYTVRYVTDYRNGGTDTNGDITLSLAELEAVEVDVLGIIGEDETLADAWTPSDWKTMPADEVPNRVNEAGCTDENARVIKQQITITSAGVLSVEFLYASGSARLNMVGVDLLDATGNVAVDDYHAGYTGTEKSANVYKFNVFAPGTYTIRYFADNSENINSTGNINLKLSVDYTLHLVAPATTPISGKWSRVTTLKADEEWNIGAVVGVIAPGQARRSFLCYSERERAVPWRAVPAYISWYEINIDRNNAAPGSEHENFTEEDCLPILREWKAQLYDKYGEAPYAFVWDDGWDTYGEWQFHSGFPNGFTNMDKIGREMGAGQGAWLGPVGGYGTSGGYRKNYWNSTKTGGMQLSNPLYYEVFVNAVTNLLHGYGYDFRFFKFDGISAQFSSVGPDPGAVGNENAEAIIMAEKVLRSIKEDVFLNTTVGTWASPFWFQHTDAIWRQEKDDGTIGNNSNNRENWITYRDRLVYQNYVQNSPLCPINTLMTHGFIFTEFGGPAGFSRDWKSVLNELRCAFACGSGMVELYNDYKLTNELVNPATGKAGELWGEIAKCMQWQRKNADVLPDIHWVGGNPWTGAKAEVYGWAAWNGQKAVLTLRNGANDAQEFTFTLREVLEIPEYITSSTITFTKAFDDQAALTGFAEGEQLDIDAEITVTIPGSSVYVFDGSEKTVKAESITLSTENDVREVPANKTLKINAVVSPTDANQSLTWTSSNTEVAIVDNGIITPVAEGEVTITATAKDGSDVSASITITVTPKVYTLAVLGTDNNGAGASHGDKQYANGASVAMDFDLATLQANTVAGMMAMVNVVGETIYISYMPSTTQFYTIKNGHGGYVSLAPDYCDEDGYLKLTNSSSIKDRRGLWAFVGNETDGYQVYNYTTGLSKVLGMTGSEGNARASMVAPDAEGYKTIFDGNIKFDGTDGRIKIQGSANNYWNKRGDYLALWNSSDAAGDDQGSKFYINAVNYNDYVDEIIPITPEAKEELDASLIQGVASFTPDNANTLWYKTSAMATGVSYPWMEYALPLGNGELGCMVFGGVLKEEIQFNEKTLWSGPANVVGAGGGNRTYFNFGSLFIKNLDETISEGVTDYVRYLDIEEGVAGVQFTNKNGTKQTRKYFSSAPAQVIAAQYKSEGTDKMHLLFKLEAESELDAKYVTNNSNVKYENGMASFSGALTAVNYAARVHVYADNNAEIITTDNGIEVRNASEVTFYLKAATNFNGDVAEVNNYFTADTPAEVNAKAKTTIEEAHTKGYATVKSAHVANFKEITGRMTLDLGLTTPTVDTKTLVDNYYPNNTEGTSTSNDHLFLEQLYFHYGRYLAISSNRNPIAAPNNLQGIWNDRASDSPWNSDVHTNINIQMNYWPTEITNLSDLHKPFLNFIIRGAQSEGWKKVAEKYNGGQGWSVLTETSLYNSMSEWGSNYLVANVWYTSHLWMHYRYTQDKEFLKQAFPVMWSAAEFWFHRLIPDKGYDSATQNSGYKGTAYKFDPDGTYVAPNEYSAEQNAHNSEDGTAHAQQMISYLFQNISDAIKILGRENINLTDEQIATLNDYLAKTDKGLHTEVYTANTALNSQWTNPRNGVNQGDIILREWKYSPYDVSDDPGHRHLSHLMALFPMDQITPESEFFEPAVNSLKLRGDAATGWSMGWKVNLWARAQDGDHAHLIIKNALKHSTDYGTNAGAGGIYYNLFDSHAPFQIDGNFGVCSGIAEMLMQSAHGYINVLPALPTVWERIGAVTGMKAMGNFTVDFNWKDGKAQQVTIVSNAGAELKVRCNRGAMDIANAMITVDGEEVTVEVDENGIATIPCAKGDEVVIDFTQERTPEEPAEFRQYWTASPLAPWNATALAAGEYPEAVSVNGLAVHKAETAVVAPVAGNVTATFVFSGGSHKLNILGVDLVNAEGTVVASDYHHGTTGGSHSNNVYTLNNVPAGEYTLRYFVGQGNGDALNQTNGAITVTGLNIPGAAASNLPKAGKYYRIGYDFGGNVGVLYMQSTNSSVKGLAMTAEKGEGSIFFVEDVNGNLRLKSISTGKYLKEDGGTRGLQTEGGNVTFTEGTVEGKVKIAATSYLHAARSNDNYYIDHCGSDNGNDAAHDFIVEEVKVRTLTVEGPANAGATATWNGATKALPAVWTVFNGLGITDSQLTINSNSHTLTGLYEKGIKVSTPVEIATLTSNRTFTAEFAPAFLSTTYGEKWVRLSNCSNKNYWATTETTSTEVKGKTATLDYADEKQLWCLVGTAESFVLYNKAAGNTKALKVTAETYGNGSLATLESDTEASWKLIEQDFGYALVPTHNTNTSNLGINMYGGAGGELKLYATGASNTGSYWMVEMADVNKPLTLNVEVDKVWESSPRVAELTFTVNGKASTTRILNSVAGQALYLPVGATYEVSSMTYRGYTFNGCTENDGVVTVSYTANDERTLYYSPRDGHPYRIPAIATAPNGDIFAICDYRPCGNDIGYGEVDLVCRVSSDNGVTWTEERTIADGLGHINDGIWKMGYGDPAIVADRESNKVLVMSVCGNRTCWDGNYGEGGENENPNRISRLYIEHDGEKWVYGQPEEVTYDIYPKFVDKDGNVHAASMFIGAGKICQSRVVKKGEYYRLYCAVWNVTKTQRQHHNYVIYSDDFGQTWNVLGDLGYENSASKWGNEPKVEELPDGTVVLSSRKYNGRYFNLFTFADDTYTTGSWMGEVGSNEVEGGLSFGGNSTNGEIYKVKAIHKVSGRICDLMFQSIPTGGGRDNVAIYYKEMEYNEDGTNKYTSTTFAQGWTKGIHVSTKGSCYSTMISQADGRIAFFFEEEPSGYCMVYIPYTIEELTDDAYTLYTVNSTIGEYKIGTFYASEAMAIPEGVQAYVAKNAPANGELVMTELTGIIPAHTGAVIRSEVAKTYNFIPSISYGNAIEGNMLVGFEAADNKDGSKKAVTVAEDYTTYVLAVENEKAGFYRKEKGTFYVFNNKAYLDLTEAAQGVRSLAIRFEGDGSTGIENSELKIQNSEFIYDLMGRRVENPAKGVYIVGGRKVVIK